MNKKIIGSILQKVNTWQERIDDMEKSDPRVWAVEIKIMKLCRDDIYTLLQAKK